MATGTLRLLVEGHTLNIRLLSVLGLSVFSLSLPLGCESTPARGNDAGRADPYATSAADVMSKSTSSVTLLEFADQVSEALAMRLPNVPDIAQKNHRVLIELGDIENNTSTRTSDFNTIRRRIFINMVNNTQITNTAQINERPDRTRRMSEAYLQEDAPDLLDEGTSGSGNSGAVQYRLEDIYTLSGTFGEIRRGGNSLYLFDVTLTNLRSREIVFAEQFEARQSR